MFVMRWKPSVNREREIVFTEEEMLIFEREIMITSETGTVMNNMQKIPCKIIFFVLTLC